MTQIERLGITPTKQFYAEWDDVDEVLWTSQLALDSDGVILRYVSGSIAGPLGTLTAYYITYVTTTGRESSYRYGRAFLSEFLFHLEFLETRRYRAWTMRMPSLLVVVALVALLTGVLLGYLLGRRSVDATT